jgi:2-keto-4-pentenoate hydratase
MGSSIRYGLAAQQLVAARTAGIPGMRLPEDCRPTNLEDALEIQRRVRLLVDDTVGGWKCSVPGPNVAAAPIYTSTIHTVSPCPVSTEGHTVRVEPEIGFVLSRNVPPQHAIDFIDEAHLVLELIGGRYAEPTAASFPELLADNLSNQGLFVGPRVTCPPDQIPGEFPIRVESSEVLLLERHGRHPDGHPLCTAHSLMQFLARHEETLTVGQIFITGSFAGVIEVPLDCPLRFVFGDLGALVVHFCARLGSTA